MCTFCTEFGHGERWYFNLENYLFDKIYPTPEEQEGARQKSLKALADTDRYGDPGYVWDLPYLRQKYTTMPGQVITLEESFKVMDLVAEAARRQDSMVVLSRCNCALTFRGKMEYRCIVFGIPITWSMEIGYARYPKEGLTEFGGAEWSELRNEIRKGQRVPFRPEEARELLGEWDRQGLQHTLVSRGFLPLIDGICNCEAPTCMRIRDRRVKGIAENVLVKGHYVARIDPQSCTLCGGCAERCQYGAIRISRWSEVAVIDPIHCFGCGLCRPACGPGAISMVPREEIPLARGTASDFWPATTPDREHGGLTAQKALEIEVDRERCRFSLYDPTGCKRCLEVCPPAVFGSTPAHPRQMGISPTVYRLQATYAELCNGCGACVSACPSKAITIKIDSSPISP